MASIVSSAASPSSWLMPLSGDLVGGCLPERGSWRKWRDGDKLSSGKER